MKLNWSHWLYTLVKTVIGGVAATGSAWLGTLIGNQVDNQIPVLQFNQLWSVLLSSSLLNLFFFLKQSPLPEDEDKPRIAPPLTLWLIVGLLSASGCGTLPESTAQRIQSAAKVAAYVGGKEYLRQHPETRPAFVLAQQELQRLATAEHLDFAVLLQVIDRLPVKELRNDRTQMIVTATTLIITDYGNALPVERLKELQPLAGAISEGLRLALE